MPIKEESNVSNFHVLRQRSLSPCAALPQRVGGVFQGHRPRILTGAALWSRLGARDGALGRASATVLPPFCPVLPPVCRISATSAPMAAHGVTQFYRCIPPSLPCLCHVSATVPPLSPHSATILPCVCRGSAAFLPFHPILPLFYRCHIAGGSLRRCRFCRCSATHCTTFFSNAPTRCRHRPRIIALRRPPAYVPRRCPPSAPLDPRRCARSNGVGCCRNGRMPVEAHAATGDGMANEARRRRRGRRTPRGRLGGQRAPRRRHWGTRGHPARDARSNDAAEGGCFGERRRRRRRRRRRGHVHGALQTP